METFLLWMNTQQRHNKFQIIDVINLTNWPKAHMEDLMKYHKEMQETIVMSTFICFLKIG